MTAVAVEALAYSHAMRIGTAQFAILGLLQDGAMSGYDVKRAIERSVGHFWQESFGSIYPTLADLAAKGLISLVDEDTSPGGRVRKRYRLTAAGKRELVAWIERPPQAHVERNELLLKLFFGSAVGTTTAVAHLKQSLRDAEGRLEEVTELERVLRAAPADDDAPYRLISIRLGAHGLGAHLAWCRESIARLEALGRSKPSRSRKRSRS